LGKYGTPLFTPVPSHVERPNNPPSTVRNLKFYALSLKLAMTEGALKFLSTVQPPFMVETCKGGSKAFLELEHKELLNLKPATVLAIPTRLGEEFSITPGFLQKALEPYLIQTTGKDKLERELGIKPGKFMISATKHYSWPKGGGKFWFFHRDYFTPDINGHGTNPSKKQSPA
jgi:hypothetical protein